MHKLNNNILTILSYTKTSKQKIRVDMKNSNRKGEFFFITYFTISFKFELYTNNSYQKNKNK